MLLNSVVRERERYKALFYATHARKLVDRDPAFALLTAVESAKIQRSFLANTALYEILDACREELRIVRTPPATAIVISDTAQHAATIDADGRCLVEELVPGAQPAWQVPSKVQAVAFDRGGVHVVASPVISSLLHSAAGNG